MSCMSLLMTISAIVGTKIAPSPELAGLPLALQFLLMMVFSIPASLGMGRYGRRLGFSLGGTSGFLGGLCAAYGVWTGGFPLLCVGTALIGIASAHATYYRFAAADTAPEGSRSKVISWVLAGGIISAILGPGLAQGTRDLLGAESFVAAYLAIATLQAGIVFTLQFIRIPRPPRKQAGSRSRSFWAMAGQPRFLVAVLCSMVGYGAMNLIMVSTPLAMVSHSHSFSAAATVIQLHVLGMFIPSFFTGSLIQRVGLRPILMTGAALILLCIAINFSGVGFLQFSAALVLLGLGWNFLFIGGSTLLVRSYLPEERPVAQAVNDFSTFTLVTLTAFGSNALLAAWGWQWVNLSVVPALLVILLLVAVFAGERRSGEALRA